MSATDTAQWNEIANINRRLFEQEQMNIQQQSLIVSEGKQWRDWVTGLRNDVDRIDVNINALFAKNATLESMTRKAFETAEGVDRFLTDELVRINQRVTDIVSSNALNDPNPSGSGATPGTNYGGGFKLPDLAGILGPLGFGLSAGAIAALGIGAFILLGGPRKLLGRR